jgi:hypothetical protein
VITRATNEAQRAFKRGGAAQALGAVDLRACTATAKILGPILRFTRGGDPLPVLVERISMDLALAVRTAASGGPVDFETKLKGIAGEIAERISNHAA